jgi:dienelactone hydrolase
VADQFAANGFTTIIPDVWEGDNVPLTFENGGDFDIPGWAKNHPPSTVEPICEAAIKALKEEYGVNKLGAAGFCLGAKYVCRLMAKGRGLDAGYIAHPSAVTSDEVKGVANALIIAAAGKVETAILCLKLYSPYQSTIICSRPRSVVRQKRYWQNPGTSSLSQSTAMWNMDLV